MLMKTTFLYNEEDGEMSFLQTNPRNMASWIIFLSM